jgi:hypothetical protein
MAQQGQKDQEEREWLRWKALVAVSVMPVACGFMFIAGRSSMVITGDGILQSIATLAAAAVAAKIVGWQVQEGFKQQKALKRADRDQEFRDKLLPLRGELRIFKVRAEAVLRVVEPEIEKGRGEPMNAGMLSDFDAEHLYRFYGEIEHSEKEDFATLFREFAAEATYIKNGAPQLSLDQQIKKMKALIALADGLHTAFDVAYPRNW